MPRLLWDASGFIKRYTVEIGTETVNALFAYQPALSMTLTYMGYAETCAALRRKMNSRVLDQVTYTAARNAIDNESLRNPGCDFLTVTDGDALAGIGLTDRHNLNASDAAILAAFLQYVATIPDGKSSCILIAADQRLLRAADAEGLKTLDPERIAPADLPAILAGL